MTPIITGIAIGLAFIAGMFIGTLLLMRWAISGIKEDNKQRDRTNISMTQTLIDLHREKNIQLAQIANAIEARKDDGK